MAAELPHARLYSNPRALQGLERTLPVDLVTKTRQSLPGPTANSDETQK